MEVPKSGNRLSTRVRDILEFKFRETFPEDGLTSDGLCFNGVQLPEEVFFVILSYVNIDEILKCSLVCKKWCNIIKSHGFWARNYYRKYKKPARRLPWYVFYCLFSTNYFDVNLLRNGNGQEKFKHSEIRGYSGEIRIEDPPLQTDPLPQNVPEFNGCTSCFRIPYECGLTKYQEISFANNNLMIYVVSHYKPHVYLSEWVAGRFYSSASYELKCVFGTDKEPEERHGDPISLLAMLPCLVAIRGYFDEEQVNRDLEGGKWQQVEMVIEDCKDNKEELVRIFFQHGRYRNPYPFNILDYYNPFGYESNHFHSCKVAGGVLELKLLFDTIDEPPMKYVASEY